MSEDVLIPKMTRLDKSKRKIKIPLLNFVIVIFCTLLIIGATFINIDIKHFVIPGGVFSNKNIMFEDFIFSFCLIPQIPIILFVCSVLGKKMAVTSVVLYILTGLFISPVFALGGGIKYILEYSFGYIFAYIPAVIFAGNILKEKYSYLNMLKATVIGVLTIHITGICYMIVIALLKHSGTAFISGWINAQSGLKIAYDLIAGFILILTGKYIHRAFKFILE